MKCIISATNAFAKWLKLDLPRIPSPDGKKIGTQSLITDSDSISWQCHVTKKHVRATKATVIAVEAYSRYVIIMPYSCIPSQEDFERDLRRHWAEQLVSLMIESGALFEHHVQRVFDQFTRTQKSFQWVKNTDLSVNGHVSDAEQWIIQSFERYDINHFDKGEAFGLGLHINKMFKRAKSPLGIKERFYPVARFVDDGLFRFASGLSEHRYPDTNDGDFPDPYKTKSIARKTEANKDKLKEIHSNVVSLSDFKSSKGSL